MSSTVTPEWIMPNLDGILPELRAIPNWVLTKPIWDGERWTKPPLRPSGKAASHSNPATWSSFDDVRAAFERGGFGAIGYVLDGKPHFNGRYLIGFDWDYCIEGGQVDPKVKATIKQLGISRIEVSVSGTGLRGFFLCDELLPSRRTRIDGRSVELYSNTRYLTTTGRGKGRLA
jgi:putative DNA primase/helicase